MFNKLDNFLDSYLPQKDAKVYSGNKCCLNSDNIFLSDTLLLYTCYKCGTVKMQEANEIQDRDTLNNPLIVKTFIPYSYNMKHVTRLHTWSNTKYCELELSRIFIYMDHIKIDDNNIIRIAKIKMKKFYIEQKIVTRNNIRRGLICYCIYTAYLFKKQDVDILELFKILNISPANYNSAVSKLKQEDRLYYPINITKYTKKLECKIDLNKIIECYSKLYLNNTKEKHNRKTFILTSIYYIIDKENKQDFYKVFNMSKITLSKLLPFLSGDNII
tara:strand:- start:2307 stop:3125 length:819 start_codon:yes stop_codon:yes gene_type:complete